MTSYPRSSYPVRLAFLHFAGVYSQTTPIAWAT